MNRSYINDEFFSRLETLAIELRANLQGFFGGKHLVRTYGQTVEFADYRESFKEVFVHDFLFYWAIDC